MSKPHLIPTGNCWCGCRNEVGLGKFFSQGHDKVAEAALIAARYEGSVARLLNEHDFGPELDRSVMQAAVDDGNWIICPYCEYTGAPASIRNHTRKYHEKKEN